MPFSEHTVPGISGDFNEDLPVKKVAKLEKNPDGSAQQVTIGLDTSLADADPVVRNELSYLGVNGELLTKIESVDETFYLVKLRQQDYDSTSGKTGYNIFNDMNKKVSSGSARRIETTGEFDPIVLVHYRDRGQDKPALTARGVHPDMPVHVGRKVPTELDFKADRFDLSSNTRASRQHFNLLRSGNSSIKLEVTSTHPTKVSYAERSGITADDVVTEQLPSEVTYVERPATAAELYSERMLVDHIRSIVEYLDRDHVYLAETKELDQLGRLLADVYTRLSQNPQAESPQQSEVVKHLLDMTAEARKKAAHVGLARPDLRNEVLGVTKELLQVRRAIREKATVRSVK